MNAHERFNSVAKKYITRHSMNNGRKSKTGRIYKSRFTKKRIREDSKYDVNFNESRQKINSKKIGKKSKKILFVKKRVSLDLFNFEG